VDKFVFHADFIIIDFQADENIPILLGRPFLANGRTVIDVYKSELTMRVNDQQVKFNIPRSMEFPNETIEEVSMIKTVDHLVHKHNQDFKDE